MDDDLAFRDSRLSGKELLLLAGGLIGAAALIHVGGVLAVVAIGSATACYVVQRLVK